MNMEQVVYLTGYVCWVSFCSGVALTFTAACVAAPIVTYVKAKRYMWQWKYASEIVGIGFTQKELKYALLETNKPDGYDVEVMLAWVESVKEQKPMRKL